MLPRSSILDDWIHNPKRMMLLWSIIVLGSAFLAVSLDSIPIIFTPLLFLTAYLAITNYTLLYQLLYFLIPFSIEVYLPGGLGTDLPSEPLMILMSGIFILILLQEPKILKSKFFNHPITILLLAHIGWTLITSISSQNQLVSFKFLLAKIWYIIPFYFLVRQFIENKKVFNQIIRSLLIGLLLTAVYVFFRHLMVGFSFAEVHYIVGPFYRNHVTYGSIICILIPFVWYIQRIQKSIIWLLIGLFLLIAMYYSYTRATYIAFLGMVTMYFVIQFRLLKPVMVILAIAGCIAVYNLVDQNRYLDFAPDYNKTITHTEFESLIDATAKGEDISTMERVYRWVAGMNMIEDKLLLGFGPGNFYFQYKPYTEAAFKTYVSDNVDKSGIHSYYLMIFVEQGLPGFLIFLALCALILIYGGRTYHLLTDRHSKLLVMAALLCLVEILAILIINDLIESDKVGPFFFMSAAIIANYHIQATNIVRN